MDYPLCKNCSASNSSDTSFISNFQGKQMGTDFTDGTSWQKVSFEDLIVSVEEAELFKYVHLNES